MDYRDEEERAADCRTHWLIEEHFHALEEEEAEKDRIIEEALLALDGACPTCFGHGGCANCVNEDASDVYEVPAC